MGTTKNLKIRHWQVYSLLLMAYDFISIVISHFLALLLRFDFHYDKIGVNYLAIYKETIVFYALACIIFYYLMRMYRSIWRFASYSDLIRTITTTSICFVVHFAVLRVFVYRMPNSYAVLGFMFQTAFAIFGRFAYRLYLLLFGNKKAGIIRKRVMLIGAGDAGTTIIKDVNNNPDSYSKVVCIIDDNPNKIGRYIEGIPVVGGRDTIMKNCRKYEINEIYFAIPSSTNKTKRDILNICRETGCEIKVLPGIQQLVNGDVSLSAMKKVQIEDLLGRDTIKVNDEEIFDYIANKTVLVTGGGGSIGSELCRQIAAHNPKLLVIFDIYENNAYDLEQELKRKYPKLNYRVLIGSVRDSKRIDNLFAKYQPDIVYHAAAHKHVPLMEGSPCESIKNNVIGTFKTAYAAMKYGAKRFVLISTDKAVNPTNIMGASKRLCEMTIQVMEKLKRNGTVHKLDLLEDCFGAKSSEAIAGKTEFVAVRFGNVLGSNGSVIPLFRKQIENGGPVTVTHPDIIRYFMTIPEAVSLVLQAGAYAKGGEIFILDMGEPVRIDTLARNLITLSGFRPDEDIKIVYTGLRPGEKLYEEKLMAEEGNIKTDNDLIFVGKPLEIDEDKYLRELKELYDLAMDNDDEKVYDKVAEIVTTYRKEN